MAWFVAFQEPSLGELGRVITAGACIEASFKRGKGEVGMDAYQVRTWQGWHHHMALSLMAVWFLLGETHRGQQVTPALTLPQVRYGLSLLLLEVFCTPGVDYICRQVHRQWLLLDSGVVDVPRSSNPLVVPLSSLKPCFFNGLQSGGALLGPWWSISPRNPRRASPPTKTCDSILRPARGCRVTTWLLSSPPSNCRRAGD